MLATVSNAIPDGGAEATVGGMDVLQALGLSEKDLTSSTFNLVMADKVTPLLVVGKREFLADYEEQSRPDVEGLLLSWYDGVFLGILHEDYPRS